MNPAEARRPDTGAVAGKPRFRWLLPLIFVAAIASALVGYRVWSERTFRAELAKADRDLAAGYFALAREKLARLDEGWPGRAEVLFALGNCEMSLGRVDAALAAWERVPPGSPLSAKAGIRRATAFTNVGKYTPAESALVAAKPDANSGEDAEDWRRAWARLMRFEGRTADVRRALREGLATAADPAPLLKELWLLDTTAVPTDGLATVLSKADPADPRVQLGRANLALSNGRIEEASTLIADLARKTPDDPAVARARLNLARAAGDFAAAQEALRVLPADALTAVEVQEIYAWLAAQLGLVDLERSAWAALLRLNPAHSAALDRLVGLSAQAGNRDESAQWLARKAEVDRAHDRYRTILLQEADFASHADELAALARTLGRSVDARAWALVAARGTAAEPEARAAVARPEPGELPERFPDLPTGNAPAPARPAAPAPFAFTDEAESAGLRFTFDHGPSAARQLPETMSGGVGVLDFDGDGFLDVYCVQGGPFPPKPGEATPGDRLFRNKGDGTFEDATVKAGLPDTSRGYGHGVTVGDFDGDRKPDLFLTRYNAYALLRNKGDGTFEDVTARAGLSGLKGWPTSAAFADLDADGDLDLYVCHYMAWDAADPPSCLNDKGEPFYCDPSRTPAERDRLYRNDGGKFVDATDSSGIVDKNGRGLGVVSADFDGDGKLDLFVANDGTANYLFRNVGGGAGGLKFEEVGQASGVAANADGGYHAGMGVACGDLDGDGLIDLVVTNFFGEAATFYQGLGGGLFTDRTAPSGLGIATRHKLGFGIALLDADNDGAPDLAIANGHVNDSRPYFPYAMPPQILRNLGRGRLSDVSDRSGPPWSLPHLGRALAPADLDNDGRVDLLILNQGEPLSYLRNRTDGGHHLTLTLQATRSQPDAIGATVTITAGGRRQVAQRFSGGSYQSSPTPRLHFGLGAATRVESVEVRWPSGETQTCKDLPADGAYLLREGSPKPVNLSGVR